MLLLFDLDNDIPCFSVRHFVALSVNNVLLSIGCPLVHFDLQNLALLLDLLALAVLAYLGRIHHCANAIALVTWTGPLRVHARPQLHHDSAHALAPAAGAGLDGGRVRAADAIALRADPLPLDSHLQLGAIVQVLKANL